MGTAQVAIAAVYIGVALAAMAVLVQHFAAARRRARGRFTPRERMIAEWAGQQVRRIEMGMAPQDLTLAIYLGQEEKPRAKADFPSDVEPAESI